MPADFHNKPFDEGTLTKLEIFELYAKEWLPVFLSQPNPKWAEVHIFDFFAGPGTDSTGQYGSPLRLLRQIKSFNNLQGFNKAQITAHFFDASPRKIKKLEANIGNHGLDTPGVTLDVRALAFEDALTETATVLSSQGAAKLVLADQFGVGQITDKVFRQFVMSPVCDFLFFISSSTLHRFREDPSIKQKITRPDDYYHVHRAAVDYYRGLLPSIERYFLTSFSVKKESNIYGIIFGSGHPLGMDKFLRVAWQADRMTGEANFDIDRENVLPGEMLLPLDELRPSKLLAFERELEQSIKAGTCPSEREVILKCFEHGVTRKHAEPVLVKLKSAGLIRSDFRVPDIARIDSPRLIQLR